MWFVRIRHDICREYAISHIVRGPNHQIFPAEKD